LTPAILPANCRPPSWVAVNPAAREVIASCSSYSAALRIASANSPTDKSAPSPPSAGISPEMLRNKPSTFSPATFACSPTLVRPVSSPSCLKRWVICCGSAPKPASRDLIAPKAPAVRSSTVMTAFSVSSAAILCRLLPGHCRRRPKDFAPSRQPLPGRQHPCAAQLAFEPERGPMLPPRRRRIADPRQQSRDLSGERTRQPLPLGD